jgi:molecular chaperone DnaK
MAVAAEPILGIDLGTTFSTAALVIDGRFHYALDSRGDPCVPSVVHFPRSGPVLVGHEAERMRATDPVNTIAGIKRVIARPLEHPAARVLDAASVFKLKSVSSGEVSVVTSSGEYTASQVASFIVRSLKERAEARFGKPMTKCFMTVPVAAGVEVRQAMVRIGRMAGLEVLRVLSEPVAGALARGLGGAAATDAPTPRLLRGVAEAEGGAHRGGQRGQQRRSDARTRKRGRCCMQRNCMGCIGGCKWAR